MLDVAGRKVGGAAQQGGFEDRAVFGGEVEGAVQFFAAGVRSRRSFRSTPQCRAIAAVFIFLKQ
jgi:hypothetical protein